MAASSGAAPEPSRTLAILLGASRWEKFETLDNKDAAPAYAAAARSFDDWLRAENGLHLPKDNILNLFDWRESAVEQDTLIREFLAKRRRETATVSDLVIGYVGHGSTMQDKKFIFILRSTTRAQREMTAYQSASLGRALKDEAPQMRKWVFLDCCAAAAAYGDFQPAHSAFDVLKDEAVSSFPKSGAALFAACSADASAYDDPAAGNRMFTAALVAVLQRGDARYGELLTLSELAVLVQAEINDRHGPDAVRPEISNPDERWGVLSVVPFFPNAARRKTEADRRVEALEARLDGMQKALAQRLEGLEQAGREQRQRQEEMLRTVREAAAVAPAPAPAPSPVVPPPPQFEDRLRSLELEAQRFWDKVLEARRTSFVMLGLGLGLLLAQGGIAVRFNGLPPLPTLQLGLMLIGLILLAGIFLVMNRASEVSWGSRPVVSLPDPALEALLREEPLFRRRFLAEYWDGAFGMVHGMLLKQAVLVLGASVLIGAFGYLTDRFGG